jgi:nucleotide-binding universal stress UspA family protein
MAQTLLVSLARGCQTQEVLEMASTLARSCDAALAVVHALAWHPLESAPASARRTEDARTWLREALEPVAASGVTVLEPVVEQGSPGDLAVELGSRLGAELIVTGRGDDAVRRWLIGSVAESIVRSASVPVLITRRPLGAPDRPVVCPVDLSPHAEQGFAVAVRMARRLGRPLSTVTVVAPDDGCCGRARARRWWCGSTGWRRSGTRRRSGASDA